MSVRRGTTVNHPRTAGRRIGYNDQDTVNVSNVRQDDWFYQKRKRGMEMSVGT